MPRPRKGLIRKARTDRSSPLARKPGNPNPSHATRFGAGRQPTHSPDHWELVRRNANTAARIRERMLEAVEVTVEARLRRMEGEDPIAAAEANAAFFVKSGMAKFIREAEEAAKPTINIKQVGNEVSIVKADDMELARAVANILMGNDEDAAKVAGIDVIEGVIDNDDDT